MPNFNQGQLEAIHHVNGPMLALAGPGSGKTTAIVYRIKYLIDEAHVNPANILVITFTRASAREMQERFAALIDSDSSDNSRSRGSKCGVAFGTFHSVFFYILKVAYGYNSDNIFSEDDKYKIIRDIVRNKQLEYEEDEDDIVSAIIKEIGLMKGDMIPIDHYYSSSVGDEVFRDIYLSYEKYIRDSGKLDFDDMMVYCYELLTERQDILRNIQRRYRYILVDEFQDINRLQYEITKMLAAPENNIFIVGDDDQSIYGFRGAKPEIMLHFKEDYPETKQTLLGVNYRCNQNVVEGASKLIKHNTSRYNKELKSAKGYREPIYVHHMKNRGEENSHILECIRKYKGEGISYSDMAIIYRTNVQAGSMVHKLMEFNIPFYTRDKVPCVYDHFAVKNIIDYITAAKGSRERSLYLRIINKPNRYIARNLLTESEFSFEKLKNNCSDKEWVIDNLEQLEYDLKVLSGLKPYAAINFIRKAIGYDMYLKSYADYRHLDVTDLFQVLDEVMEMSKQYESVESWFEGIKEYRGELVELMKNNRDRIGECITVTTMHSAKGLEFEAVFIPEANERLTPYKKAALPEEIEEERRMFYVAMTRAKSHLHIYDVRDYYNKELEPSRFLSEMQEEVNEDQL